MTLEVVYSLVQLSFLLYLVALTGGYLALNVISLMSLRQYFEERTGDRLPGAFTGYEPQISIIMPAYNEAATIASSIQSLLQLQYSEYEIIVVSDGSTDDTMDVLRQEFGLKPFPEAYSHDLPTQPVRAIYHSSKHPNVRVIDKDNGGKADSLNAGINLSVYPLFCCIDADSILAQDSLYRVVQPFLLDHRTIATGGTIRVANGCVVENGLLKKVGLPSSFLALLQTVEYLRAFLSGRQGWSPLNAMLIIAGAFGLFRKESVLRVGGYRTNTIGEDMELVVRLHHHYRLSGQPYRITYVPDPVCWTEVPEDFRTLRNQRIRWQRGLCDSLGSHFQLCCHPKSGAVGWLAFPFMTIFEWFGPVFEIIGYVFLVIGLILGIVSWQVWLACLGVVVGLGVTLSLSAFLMEEMTFHLYQRRSEFWKMLLVAFLENFGYRQLNSYWRLVGLIRWVRGTKAEWGNMIRSAAWQSQQVRPGNN
ncbi:MAG: glycosyltransferase family 2 protein [Nitrospira sp.]|nr:glycosyltransferase family 2 protein [Nitrospira sp.]MDH4368879.1 glycosyltransferase family 2 protein [Nitrospira sp.]MDH5348884.1 glycosyltransferase family 2 protein [Nitrospira sp.]